RLAEGDVVRDGAGEQVRLLGDHRDVAAEVLHRYVPQVHAVQRHPTLGGVVEAGDELGDRGLAGTGLAHQGDGLAGGDVQVHRLQHQRAVLGVAEGNVLEVDLPARGGQRGGGRRFLHVRLHREEGGDLLERGDGGLEGVVEVRDL